jgi:hypothetical protein
MTVSKEKNSTERMVKMCFVDIAVKVNGHSIYLELQ